jgi:serine/threonine protein kinase
MAQDPNNSDSEPKSDLPRVIGRYAVKRELGRGGMGVVYLAHDAQLERDVAIKTLPGVDETNPDRLRRFEREAKVLAAISHPNIATIYSIEKTDDGLRFLVLEYVEGDTLSRLLKKSALNLRESLDLCAQMAKAIAAAHAKGIVHRDIKPGNVMVTPDMTVKVLDFGLSMREAGAGTEIDVTRTVQTMPGQIMGTPGYMSPEQARGKQVDKRTDIWSFGCIVFQCLTGHPAFTGETSTDVIASTLHHNPDWSMLPVNTPRNLRDLLERMLAKSPEQRLDDLSIALAVLNEAAGKFSSTGSTTTAHYGEFVAVKEIAASPKAMIWEVKPASDSRFDSEKRYVAKIIEPSSVLLAPNQTMRVLDTFRNGAMEQKRLGDDPEARHWANVYDYGQFPGGAYYITDYVEYSAADLMNVGSGRTPADLHAVISGTIEGLRELDRVGQRPHGNIKPSNILLMARQSPNGKGASGWDVLLTDILSDADIEASALRTDNDLNEVGKVLFRLVEGEEWRGRFGSEVPETAAWSALGRSGAHWRKLCNDLLSASPPTLQEVAARLEPLKPRQRGLPMIPIGIAACVILLALAGFFMWPGEPEPPIPPDPRKQSPHTTERDEWERQLASARQEYLDACGEPFSAKVDLHARLRELDAIEWDAQAETEQRIADEIGSLGREVNTELASIRDGVEVCKQRGADEQLYLTIKANWLGELLSDDLRPMVDRLMAIAPEQDRATLDQRFQVVRGFDRTIDRENDLTGGREDDLAESYTDALERVGELQEKIDAVVRRRSQDVAAILNAHGWTEASRQVRGLAEGVRALVTASDRQELGADDRIGARLDRFFDAVDEEWLSDLRQERDGLTGKLDRVESEVSRHGEAEDPVLSRLRESVEQELAAARIDDLSRRMTAWSQTLDSVEKSLRGLDDVDLASLRRESDVYRDADRPDGLRRTRFERWAEETQKYVLMDAEPPTWPEIAREIAAKRNELEGLRGNFNRAVCPDVAEPNGFRVESIEEELAGVQWDRRPATHNRLQELNEELRDELTRKVAAWQQAVNACGMQCEEHLTQLLASGLSLHELPEASIDMMRPIQREWERVEAGGDLECDERRTIAQNLERAVRLVRPRLFSPAASPDELPRGVNEDRVTSELQQKWGSLVGPILDELENVDWSSGILQDDPMWLRLNEAKGDYDRWVGQVRDLLADYKVIDEQLHLASGWEAVQGRFQPEGRPWPDRSVYAELSATLDELPRITRHVERLQEMEAMSVESVGDAQRLVGEIRNEQETPAYRWTAWRKLGHATQYRDFLNWEDEAGRHIETMLRGLPDEITAGTLRNTWQSERRERWNRNARTANDPRWLREAFGWRANFGIDSDDQIADDRLRFNLELDQFRDQIRRFTTIQNVTEADADAIKQRADELAKRLSEIAGPEADREAWVKLLSEMAQFDLHVDDDAGGDMSQVGPARAGWHWEVEDEGRVIRYTPPQEWLNEYSEFLPNDFQLVFRRVGDDDMTQAEAPYLSTTEVNAGLFIATARATGLERLLYLSLLRTFRDWDRDLREFPDLVRNARVWRWDHAESSLELMKGKWFIRQPDQFDGWLPAPTSLHPMQQVSVGAALAVAQKLGSRIPTTQEWRAALDAELARSDVITANLFNAEFDQVRQKAKEIDDAMPGRSLEWLNFASGLSTANIGDGVAPVDDLGNVVRIANRRWIQEVSYSSSTFEHLLGNVAEFVLGDHANLDELPTLSGVPSHEDEEQLRELVNRYHQSLKRVLNVLSPAERRELGQDSRMTDPNVHIIGGSIFWDIARHPLRAPIGIAARSTLNNPPPNLLGQQTYPDVGFRLAFTASVHIDPKRRFQQVVREQVLGEDAPEYLLAGADQ